MLKTSRHIATFLVNVASILIWTYLICWLVPLAYNSVRHLGKWSKDNLIPNREAKNHARGYTTIDGSAERTRRQG